MTSQEARKVRSQVTRPTPTSGWPQLFSLYITERPAVHRFLVVDATKDRAIEVAASYGDDGAEALEWLQNHPAR